ncbi:hypothetical protein COCCADRAFT_35381 [Bipolaris zeicola 26-R-13]|uniref:Uncharacterized protein n=1 Tax=Cochliobolus carbonum (strain 26-R-13) TaxID=930089 RepID=W6YU39_COCC2|nr:uncharacterized protein COCCADRAFT_35381 [Bipolaris zeicola 26-R-13]EUC35036.1 hypothetical protein COCCADRAFT_35381 [Bipolaris zeicola 26-R-13]
MSGVVCAWANLPEEAVEWYENEFLPQQRNVEAMHSIHCEVTASGMEHEPVGKLDAPWPFLTVYEVKDVARTNKKVDVVSDHLEAAKIDPLKHVNFDVRSYREVKRWQNEEFEGNGSPDIEHVASIAAMEWTVDDAKEEEILKYYYEVVGPTISSSPDVLRFRLFKLDRAVVVDKDQKRTCLDNKNLHKYFTLVELESEEWPWDVVVDLAENPGWSKYFETQTVVKWQLSHYLTRSTFWEYKKQPSAS